MDSTAWNFLMGPNNFLFTDVIKFYDSTYAFYAGMYTEDLKDGNRIVSVFSFSPIPRMNFGAKVDHNQAIVSSFFP